MHRPGGSNELGVMAREVEWVERRERGGYGKRSRAVTGSWGWGTHGFV